MCIVRVGPKIESCPVTLAGFGQISATLITKGQRTVRMSVVRIEFDSSPETAETTIMLAVLLQALGRGSDGLAGIAAPLPTAAQSSPSPPGFAVTPGTLVQD